MTFLSLFRREPAQAPKPLPMDARSICERLERRPLPQIPPGPLTRPSSIAAAELRETIRLSPEHGLELVHDSAARSA